MAIFHCSIKIVSRGKGKSAVASAAYRSGEKITNEYDGESHDYTRKGGIAFTGILLPDNAPKEYQDRSTLWNAVEKIEKSKNAQLARDIEVSIPKEIPREYWQRLMTDYCKSNFVNKGMIADFCIHDKDPNNPHCHILLTMRPIDKSGKWGAKSRKEYVLDDEGNRIKLPSGNWKSRKVDTTDWNSQDNAELWRENWSKHCNLYLENLGQSERIDHRSYERQGIDKIPSIHLGVQASQMEQKDIATERGNINRSIAQDNKNLRATRAIITRLMKWQREEKARPLDLSQTGFKASVMDKLQANKEVLKYQNQKTANIKNQAKVFSFLQTHDINSIEEFSKTIVDMNESFYALQREMKSSQTGLDKVTHNLTLWQEYEKLKPLRAKHNTLKSKAQKQFYDTHIKELTRADELHQRFSDFVAKGNKILPKEWKKSITILESDIDLCEWKMTALKDEIGSAEKIKKALDEMMMQEPIISKKKELDR
ncbi:MAG: MobQ family relaxase [Brevinema sp.]